MVTPRLSALFRRCGGHFTCLTGTVGWPRSQNYFNIPSVSMHSSLSFSLCADWAIRLLWKVKSAPWPNVASEPKAAAVASCNLCLMLEMSEDNNETLTHIQTTSRFLLCNNNSSVTVANTQRSQIIRCRFIIAVKESCVFSSLFHFVT